jgi:uroporphyrinogen decarboxylase
MNATFLDACLRKPTSYTPVWYMRQAGRFQAEYRKLRETYGILDICRTPELAFEVTMLPVTQLGVDAAILFSDIMIPVAAMGVDLRIDPGKGPVIGDPIRSAADVERLHAIDTSADLAFIDEAIAMLVAELEIPLIGFCGGPFTLSSYLVEGGASRQFAHTKALMYGEPKIWHSLMEKLADTVVASLRAQVAAGASAVQLFDSWVGQLSPQDYVEYVMPHSRRIFVELADLGVPRIHFGVLTGELLEQMRDAGADVVGVDWRTPMDVARGRLGDDVAVQGNLDPVVLLAGWDAIESKARDVLRRAEGASGFVFNLGHGVLPQTDPRILRRLTDFVHEETAR